MASIFKGHRESLLWQSVGERKRWTHSSNNEKPAIKERPRGREAVNTHSLHEEELYLGEKLQDPAPRLHSSLQGTEQEHKSHNKRVLAGTLALLLGHRYGSGVL